MDALVSFRTNIFASSITRPANTTAYSTGDVVASAGNAGFVIGSSWAETAGVPDVSVARRFASTKSGTVDWITLISSANQATKMAGELWLFNAPIGTLTDNAAFALTDSLLESSLLGVFPFVAGAWIVGNATAGDGGNALVQVLSRSHPIILPDLDAGGTGQLYAALVTRDTYTPVSGEKFTLRMSVSRD